MTHANAGRGADRDYLPMNLSIVPENATSAKRRIVIVGGGYTSSLLAVNLLRQNMSGADIVPIERSPAIRNPHHLLNVRASNMSAFADDPTHFLRWLMVRSGATAEDAGAALGNVFVPRLKYGLYIEDVFRKAVSARGAAAADPAVIAGPAAAAL